METDRLFQQMVAQKASDMFLKVGSPPFLRIEGKLCPCDAKPFEEKELLQLAYDLMGPFRRQIFQAQRELNFAFERPGIGRFRANVLWQRGNLAMVIRRIQGEVPSFEELNLPAAVLRQISDQTQGLVLITGPTGSGKPTTSAAILESINRTRSCHILTLEDPIEYLFDDRESVIDQREIGVDTATFSEGLKNALRQSLDVLFISDIRDQETMETALLAAESGQMVISCIHTTNALTTLERLMAFFPPHQQETIRFRLSQALRAILSLRLLPRCDQPGQIPACEILIMTPTIRELIREGSDAQITPFLYEGTLHGMQTMTQALYQLVHDKKVSLQEALQVAESPEELQLALREIRSVRNVRGT